MSEHKSLVIGGTSGLGLEIGKILSGEGDSFVTGRHDPEVEQVEYRELDLSGEDLSQRIGDFVMSLPTINTVVYAAGYYQEGRVTDLSDEEIEQMINVGGRGLIYIVRELLKKQGELDELITITSTSQWTPREKEPIYNFVKSGAGHLSNGLAEDERIGKVLVAGPSGMNTAFWDGVERDDLDQMLDPAKVAEVVLDLSEGDYKYKFAKILRNPLRVEEVEER